MTDLTTRDKRTLAQCEETIKQGQRTFIDVGNALRTIRDEVLYRGEFETFEAYMQKKWGWTRQRGYQLIAAANVVEVVGTIDSVSTIVDINEGQARELGKLGNDEDIATVAAKAVETAPKDKDGKPRLSAAHIRKVADDVLGNGSSSNQGPEQGTDEHSTEADDELPPVSAEWNRALRAVCYGLRRELAGLPEGAWMDKTCRDTLSDQLKAVTTSIRMRQMDVECGCNGGCNLCRMTGWMPQRVAEQSR